jgi:hypothetical protein
MAKKPRPEACREVGLDPEADAPRPWRPGLGWEGRPAKKNSPTSGLEPYKHAFVPASTFAERDG